MGLITKPKSWIDNENVIFSDLNSDFDTLYNEFNGNIDNSNIKPGAAIVESKTLFSASGHGHTGGTDGKPINARFGFFVAGSLAVNNDLSWNPICPQIQTMTTLYAYCKIAPTGSGITVQVYNITQAKVVASVTISPGAQSASTTSMTNAVLAAGDILRVDITLVGSTIAGSNLSIELI